MNKIKVLSEEVANRIAAGEVIERPVSIVKELVENSIDAFATKITVTIENGGKRLIKVVDNGTGMSEDDAFMAFERHATSKIRTVSDIFHISTLGFRGEALPSIASVSKLTLITKEKDSDLATKIQFDSGRLKNMEKVAANTGTTVIVEKLFNFIPARKKFLKSDQVEFKHIINFLHYQAILHPEIHFRFISNGREKFNYPVSKSYKERLFTIFGKEIFDKAMMPIDEQFANMRIYGYIGTLNEDTEKVEHFRYLFVNNRFVRDKVIFHAIKTGYEPFVQKLNIFKGKLPPFILFLEVTPELVDFNVHPAKLEIRFVDSTQVHSFVKDMIKKVLLKYEEKKFNNLKKELINTGFKEPELLYKRQKTEQKRLKNLKKDYSAVYERDLFSENKTNEQLAKVLHPERMIAMPPEEEIINPWQLHNMYIFLQTEDGLIVIDQHAAHERIIYEKLLKRVIKVPKSNRKLLFPIVIKIPQYLKHTIPELIEKNLDVFTGMGFSIKTFSDNSVVIDAIPMELEDWNGEEIFLQILNQLQKELEETGDFRDSLSKSVACKAAIKAGKKMTKKEMITLINDLFRCDVPYFCPHGRPLIIKITLDEFNKKFRRVL